ncbi:MAG: sigma-54-dependent Fis family transcriptional regulator [Nitrospina sp.]|jgi:DNA-binding NtrC family response regulator|nr:sigma-54-dependent Fis family transcriptional regulator [Nitrospina sp.]
MKSSNRKILIVDDEPDFIWLTRKMLQENGYIVIEAQDGESALRQFEKEKPDMVLLDYLLPGRNGLQVAIEMKDRVLSVPLVMITGYGEVNIAVKAMKAGIYDYVIKPVDKDDLLFTIERALEKQALVAEIERLRNALKGPVSLYDLMGKSGPVKTLVNRVKKVAPTPFTVLIEGESGTGKELVANAIHDLSSSAGGPFVCVDCGAIPETLIESELFGFMKGAFTGAYGDKPGLFELADGGTLFLDEVGNISYVVQQKLLRAVQERAVQRLGAKGAVGVDVRIIAATNQALEKDVEAGRFRSDLYFRLNEFSIKTPSLRARSEDIPYLAMKFMDEAGKELEKKCGGFSEKALISLSSYDWPGNVRELRNLIRQAVLLSEENGPIRPEHLTFSSRLIHETKKSDGLPAFVCDGRKSLKKIVTGLRDVYEKKVLEEVLALADGNKSETARRLKIDYTTLHRKIKFHHIA